MAILVLHNYFHQSSLHGTYCLFGFTDVDDSTAFTLGYWHEDEETSHFDCPLFLFFVFLSSLPSWARKLLIFLFISLNVQFSPNFSAISLQATSRTSRFVYSVSNIFQQVNQERRVHFIPLFYTC